MNRFVGVLALGLSVLMAAGCGDDKPPAPPKDVAAAALEGLLPNAEAIDSIMGTSGMVAHPPTDRMSDNRNLLPNLDCLGVWQVDESAIYGTGWTAMRQQLFRNPDTDEWERQVVESGVLFGSGQDAKGFFDTSAEHWSKCTNHHVNITVNGGSLPRWASAELTVTDSALAMPYTRVKAGITWNCQHALGVAANLIIDVQACQPGDTAVTAAADIVQKVIDTMPR